ncbi:MAG: hypothetical protein HUJ25_08225 [Crocinitomicaceae bacterium]|nr:hypothetical protein [Crocinitomicaceae bacterium]
MKTLLFVITFVSGVSYAQQTNGTVQKVPVNTTSKEFPPNTAEHDSLKAVKIHNDSIDNQIDVIDQQINAIDTKWDWVMNNPEQKLIAEEEGWFDQMTINKQELLLQRQQLLDSKK